MLTRWAVALAGVDPLRVTPDQLHAVVSSWLDDGDHDSASKPWSASPVDVVDGVPALRLATLTDDARDRLITAVTPSAPVRFGSQIGRILSPPIAVEGLHEQDLSNAGTADAWCVSFVTPTAFGKGGGRGHFSPWPDPSAVVRSLCVRWNAAASDRLDMLTHREVGTIWVSDVDGCNEVLSVRRLTVSGFVGRIRYVCHDRDVAVVFDRLIRFAEFSGLGRYSTHGLGVVRLEPTWPARR